MPSAGCCNLTRSSSLCLRKFCNLLLLKQGHAAPTREDLEHADAGMAKPDEPSGPSGRPGDPYTQGKDGIDRNAGLGEFPPGDPASGA